MIGERRIIKAYVRILYGEFQKPVNELSNWPNSALTLFNKLCIWPCKVAIALVNEPAIAFKGCSNQALVASVAAYEPSLAFKCCTNCS